MQSYFTNRILLIDSYDSFTLNLASLIHKVTGAEVVTIHNDSVDPEILISNYLPLFDAVVIGPGPGSPGNQEDVGVLPYLWRLSTIEQGLLPIFGVCLGFQSLVLATGGDVKRLPQPKHGQIAMIENTGTDLFQGISESFESVRYHSLHCIIPDEILGDGVSKEFIIPLAWTDDPHTSHKVLMAGKHSSKPFWGVQYHPESICSTHGETVVKNFWNMAKAWAQENGRVSSNPVESLNRMNVSTGDQSTKDCNAYTDILKLYSIKPLAFPSKPFAPEISHLSRPLYDIAYQRIDIEKKISTAHASILICESLQDSKRDFTLLNSAAFPGRWSIIGLLEPGITTCIKYYNDYNSDYAFVHPWQRSSISKEQPDFYENEVKVKLNNEMKNGGIWGFLSSYMAPKIAKYKNSWVESKECGKTTNIEKNDKQLGKAPPGATFCGGLTGYISYEAPQDLGSYPSRSLINQTFRTSINNIDTSYDIRPYPDINLVDIERMILLDSQTNSIYVVSLKEEEGEVSPWFDEMNSFIRNSLVGENGDIKELNIPTTCYKYFENVTTTPITVEIPNKDHYIKRIFESQEELRAGNSYELCLTGQTKITLPQSVKSWDLYKVLYKRNPAPYSCFFDFPGAILVGSSPERFMNWSGRTGRCEFRPIKGTVKKGPDVTYESASAILNTPKERGENLMIVDLIRHDLNALLDDVQVEKLMGVEEYKTVYQLVSVISGNMSSKESEDNTGESYSGFDVLVHSLPPGSMTGAPKIRSIEILRELEDKMPRGIYSGVSGYWSVLDEGDWSVIIRSAFRYKNESASKKDAEVWRIGAGGAITILSDAEDEWHEMSIKLESALQAFN